MQIEVVENVGPNTLLALLRERLKSATSVRIAAAFVSRAGLDRVQAALRGAAKRGRVLFLTGLYQGVTEPSALALLARIEKANPRRFFARLSRNRKYHRKLYLLGSRRRLFAVAGSSNLTLDGLTSRGEASVGIGLHAGSPTACRLINIFERDWKNGVRVTKTRVSRYMKWRPANPQANRGSASALAAILGKDEGDSAAPEPVASGRWWRDCITGFVGKVTENAVGQETDWDGRTGWSWYAAGRNQYVRGDMILMFDHADKQVYVAKVEETTELTTPDGRHFVAFSRPRMFAWKRMRERVWRRFGIPNKEATEQRRPLGARTLALVDGELKRR